MNNNMTLGQRMMSGEADIQRPLGIETLTNILMEIQTRLKVKKSSYNSFGKYHFRKAEDILEALKPLLKEFGCAVTLEEELLGVHGSEGLPCIKTVARISDGNHQIEATSIVGVDLNQKGMQTAQQFGAASSYGKKYALGNLFLIDDTADSDATNDHGKTSKVIEKIKTKAKLDMTDAQMRKAKEWMGKGGTIEAIEMKYKLTKKQLKELNDHKANNKEA